MPLEQARGVEGSSLRRSADDARPARRRGGLAAALAALVRTHWPLLAVLAVAALIRALVAVAYGAAFLYSDSWVYLDLAFGDDSYSFPFLGFTAERPSGYSAVIKLLSQPFGLDLGLLTTVQHLAGLATGVLVYALLHRLGARVWLATAAAAVVLLDSYAITLEHHIMTEPLFTLALVLSVYLLITVRSSTPSLVASGALLGAAATMRTVALMLVPLWLVYVVWRQRGWRAVLVLACSAATPLLLYASLHAARTGEFGMGQASGWFLYGRIGQIADCRHADIPREGRGLCRRNATDRRLGATYHIWSVDSPARRTFGGMLRGDRDQQQRSDRILGEFARAIIADRPDEYAELVVADFLRYFKPGVETGDSDRAAGLDMGASDSTILLPERPRLGPYVNEPVYRRIIPDYHPIAEPPANALRAYQSVVHVPRPLIAALALAAVLSLALALVLRRRYRPAFAAEMLPTVGAALVMLLASAALSHFALRYLVPAVPLIVTGGVLAAIDLAAVNRQPRWANQRRRSRSRNTTTFRPSSSTTSK